MRLDPVGGASPEGFFFVSRARYFTPAARRSKEALAPPIHHCARAAVAPAVFAGQEQVVQSSGEVTDIRLIQYFYEVEQADNLDVCASKSLPQTRI